jgi:hypothetical protein
MKIFGIILIVFISFNGFSQKKGKKLRKDLYGQNTEWSEGSIMLADGKELKGVVRYNDKTGVLSYDDGAEPRTFTSRSVASFGFFDEGLQQQRTFYSLEYSDPADGIARYYFFEVLKDFGDFAVISKTDRINIEQKSSPSGGGMNPATGTLTPSYSTTSIEYSQTETIFFMNADGKIEAYLKIIEKDIDRTLFDGQRTKNRFMDELVFIKYASDVWADLESYADENHLSFKRKADLLQILNEYQRLRSN